MLSYKDFVKRLNEIKSRGWIKTHRAGPTGIGKTLEDLLDIDENNIAGPDHKHFELKSARKSSQSMLTLFTKAPLPKKANADLLSKFGYVSAKGNNKKEIHTTVNCLEFNKLKGLPGFKIEVREDEDKMVLIDTRNSVLGYWDKLTLKSAFVKKYPALMYVKADSRGTDKNEEFFFNEAYMLKGFDFDNFLDLVEKGTIKVDVRIGQYSSGKSKGKTHDHGTGFRIKPEKLDLCFGQRKKII